MMGNTLSRVEWDAAAADEDRPVLILTRYLSEHGVTNFWERLKAEVGKVPHDVRSWTTDTAHNNSHLRLPPQVTRRRLPNTVET